MSYIGATTLRCVECNETINRVLDDDETPGEHGHQYDGSFCGGQLVEVTEDT